MIEIYHWEDDRKAERLIRELKKRKLEYQVTLLDPEVGGQPSVTWQGKTYWDFTDFRKALAESE